MKNIVKINLLFIALVSLLSFGCKPNQFTDYSTMVNKFSELEDILPNMVATAEKDTVYNFPFTLNEAPIVDMKISVQKIAGTATEGEDFDILTPLVVVKAFTKTGVISIGIKTDDVIDSPESFTIQVGSEFDANVKVFKNIDVTISEDYIGSDLDITFNWGDFSVETPDFGTIPVGLNFDIDIYVLDEEGNDTEDYSAASASNPEHITYTVPDDEGTYYFAANLWANVFTANGVFLDDLVPITMDFHRDGVLGSFTKTQADEDAFNLSSLDLANDGDATLVDLAKLVVGTDNFMVYNPDGSSLVNARRKNPARNHQSQKPVPSKAFVR